MTKASPGLIQRFLDTFGSNRFRHADKLVPIMRRNAPDESEISLYEMRLADQLRDIYRTRAAHLAVTPPSPRYPPGLADDVRALSARFESAKDQKLRLWRIALPSGTDYSVWELVKDRDIAGVVMSADQRILRGAWSPP